MGFITSIIPHSSKVIEAIFNPYMLRPLLKYIWTNCSRVHFQFVFSYERIEHM